MFEAIQARGYARLRGHVGALVASRRFEQARQLSTRVPQRQVEALPLVQVRPSGGLGPSALKVTVSGALEESINLSKGPRIVVVSHPLCHFSQRAVAAIEHDAVLAKALNWAFG